VRSVLLAVLSLSATVPMASAHPRDPAYANAGVSPLASVDATAVILPGADVGDFAVVGPNVQVGADILARRTLLTGRVSGAAVQPFRDSSVLSRGAVVGADADIAEDVVLGRDVIVGSRLVAGSLASAGYASILGDDVTLGTGAVLGKLVTVGDRSSVSGTISRGAVLGDDVDVDGVLGPDVQVGNGATVDGRVRKNAVIGSTTEVDRGARMGRNSTIGFGAVIGDDVNIGANAVGPHCAWLPGPQRVFSGQTWAGTLYMSGFVLPNVLPGIYPFASQEGVGGANPPMMQQATCMWPAFHTQRQRSMGSRW
jgi:UDP-3-O-[3-hydroxymyristoyl] glucosamine N-acyltransferase